MMVLTRFAPRPSLRLAYDPRLSWGDEREGPMSSKFRHSASSKQNHVLNYY